MTDEEGKKNVLSTALKPLFKPVVTTEGEHRRLHRVGRPSRLDWDAELANFASECLVTMTFPEAAAAIAARFPPDRRTSASGLHRWWHRQRRLATTSHDHV